MSLALAVCLDWLCGEPPARLHPVVWMGRVLGLFGRYPYGSRPALDFMAGAVFWSVGATLFTGAWWTLAGLAGMLPVWAEIVVCALLLKPLFSARMLIEEVRQVDRAFADGLPAARKRLSRIVSRDTRRLEPAQVREGAIESLAENLSDSLIAPLFWYLLLGLPGAALYRFANTADAMWGYRDEREYFGKWAARADDALNFIPARLAALFLALVSGPKPWMRLRTIARDARHTPSPNAGWPMAAIAHILGCRLGRPHTYALNAAAPPPGTPAISRAITVALRAAALACTLFAAAALLRFPLHG